MLGVNTATIVGTIGQDIELKQTPKGNSVASFSMATNEKYKDGNGTVVEKTQWHNIVAWGKVAELIAQYCGKGSALYVQGKLETRTWEDKDSGKNMYRTEIVVRDFQFIGGNKNKDTAPDASNQTPKQKNPPTPNDGDLSIEDIPF